MAVPTRIIEKPEFEELMRTEGSTVPLFRLDAVGFQPPRPKEQWGGEPGISINVLMLNVIEPVIYKDGRGDAYIIMSAYDDGNTFTYANFQDCHYVKGAWYYRLAPAVWQANDDDFELAEAIYCFDHGGDN